MTTLKVGTLVWNKKEQKQGKVAAILPKGDFKVEIIVSKNEKEGTRTTKLENWNKNVTVVYTKPKSKGKLITKATYFIDKVREFHLAFKHPVALKPAPLAAERALNRTVWTGEELVEFLQASVSTKEEFDKLYTQLIEGLDAAYTKSVNAGFPQSDKDKLIGQADAITDILYFLSGTIAETGLDIKPVFDIVHAANMGKLHDGKPVYREDGKIQKPANWENDFSPEKKIEAEIKRQLTV